MNYLSNKLSKHLGTPSFNSNRRQTSLAPSAASTVVKTQTGDTKVVGACHRQQFYRLKNFIPDAGAQNIDWALSALIGDKLHDLLVELIDVYGVQLGLQKITREHSIYEASIKLSGRSDLLLWDYNRNEPIGVEIKSIGEYKAKKAIEAPIEEHVLQSVLYLDFYNKAIPEGQKKITKWYIWYVSRTENWSIKSKSHGSDFTMMWDYLVELDNGVPIITLSDGTKQRWEDYSIKNIYDRYKKLYDQVEANTIPPRDYEIIYSDEKIVGLYKAGLIEKKGDKELIEKWLDKGAPAGKLKVQMGDGECMFCEYKKLCWEGVQNTTPKAFSNLPTVQDKPKKIDLFL